MGEGALEVQKVWGTPEDHLLGLHPPGSVGRVTLACKQGARWQEFSYPVNDLAYAVRQLRDLTDVYVTQNRFWAYRRRIAYLAQLDTLFADLDFYNVPDLAGRNPWHVLEMALMSLEEARIPTPSVAVNSGRGLALLWLHQPVPRKAIPRWNACQKTIFEALRHLGADARARDPARVLRLIGSTNSKNGAPVEALTPTQTPWDFDTLADEILPLTRTELFDLRIQRAARRAKGEEDPNRYRPEGFNAATLWENRLTALQKLRQIRWFGNLPPGHRDFWLFTATVGMSWIAIPPVLRRESFALAEDVGGWSEAEAKSNLQTVISRAIVAAKGQTVDGTGKTIDPRYRLSDDWIIEHLQITPDEQRQLPCLWGPEVRREKDRERKIRERRAAGVVDRQEYLAQAAIRRSEATKLRLRGMSIRQIASELGCSPSEVSRLLG